ncbi:FAD binding domain-containing protein [Lichenicoccus sp.]|uniref:FAD binding domain-containing protein n=1 Tax=Lichenicoccus sp. TaxID=2781899 RepID=UPI003D0B83FC
MRAFSLSKPGDLAAASAQAARPETAIIAGGTDLVQLMRLDVEKPARLVDIAGLDDLAQIRATSHGIRLGALATMAQVAANPDIVRRWPAVSEALLSAASPQIRNMGTVGGNLLQRTRCLYFRSNTGPCNKRDPGSGCPAIAGENRDLAILGGSAHCIATMPSDLPVALAAFDAQVELRGLDGAARSLPIAALYREPGTTPHLDTNLRPGEIITAVTLDASPAAARSTYVKIRDRQSFQFAVVSVAVGLDVQGGIIRDARVAFGGVGTVPWRALAVEAALRDKAPNAALFRDAASKAAQGAAPASQNGFKAALMPRVLARTLSGLA